MTRPDSTGPGSCNLLSTINVITNGVPLGLAKKGDYLYAGNGSNIYTIDVRNPGSPSVLSIFPEYDYGTVGGIAISGIILATLLDNQLWLFDITSPVSPIEISHITLSSGDARDIAIYGDYLYIGKKGMGLSIVDISDPYQPVELTRMENYPTNCLVFSAGRLYAGKEYGVGTPTNQRIWKFDPTDPDSLNEIDYTNPPGNSAFDMDYIYGHLFLASGKMNTSSNTGTFNIISKTTLSTVFSANTDYICMAIGVENNFVYVVDSDLISSGSNLYVYNAYNPESAYLAHTVSLSSRGRCVLADDGIIYVLCESCLQLFEHSY